MSFNSTIVAQSTPVGKGAIAVVRLSGPEAINIAQKIIQKNIQEKINSQRLLETLKDKDLKVFDQALLIIFENPKSYTGEDLVEFHCHGNQLIVNKLIETALFYGAVLANPGEFTQRAFLNGKLNLTQSEAIMDLIQSKSEKMLQTSSSQLLGSLGSQINVLENKFLEILSLIQGPLDFPIETEFSEIDEEKIFLEIENVKKNINKLIQNAQIANILRNGIKTVIIGRPNVGKSSLLNLLLNSERAIVSSEPGTTRDFISEEILIRDIPITLIDTAGLREETDSKIELQGIKKAQNLAKEAELILFVFDSNEGFLIEDKVLFDSVCENRNHSKIILLANKCDLKQINKNNLQKELNETVISISADTGNGLQELEKEIEMLLEMDSLEGDFEFSLNQRQALIFQTIKNNLSEINNEFPVELISTKIQEAVNSLNELKGEGKFKSDQAATSIFSGFCIGK